ncbi:MAG: GntR family transcriptional regulator [Victivallales bacterium]
MLNTIDRGGKTSFSVQISEKLIAGIRSGVMKPGRRIPGIRVLAQKFGTSNNTVIEALDLMEKQNYIERIPAKGTFVSDDVSHELSLSRLVFPFPESSISPEGGLENWGIVTEFYRGALTEAAKLNAEILFHHFEEAKDEIVLSRQLRRMNDFDGGIFAGDQLHNLRDGLIAKNKPCALLGSSSTTAVNICGSPDEAFNDVASLLAERGYKKLRILIQSDYHANQASEEGNEHKMGCIIRAVKAKGIIADASMIHELKDNDDATVDATFAKLVRGLKNRREAFFSVHTDIVPAVYRYAARKNLRIGEDFGIFGYASGITFSNLVPEFTFSKINHFEMGKAACRTVVDAIHGGEWHGKSVIIPNTLVVKHSI